MAERMEEKLWDRGVGQLQFDAKMWITIAVKYLKFDMTPDLQEIEVGAFFFCPQ